MFNVSFYENNLTDNSVPQKINKFDISSLKNGAWFFKACPNITSFTSDLSSLINGEYMFYNCANLTTFTSDLSSLTNGWDMFYACANLTSFSSDLSSLTDGYSMFGGCTNLTSFSSDLSSLTNGYSMFNACFNLTTFTSDLSSLTNGYEMFYNCILDTESLIYIADTIKDVRDLTNGNYYGDEIYKTIHIGIGNTTPTVEEKELLTEIHNKGWQVYVNGSSNSNIFNPTATTPIDGEETTTPIPYWAKPVEVDKEHANYVGEDGKYYIILGGNYIFVDDPETYGLFVSEEDAALNMRLTKYERSNETDEIETA